MDDATAKRLNALNLAFYDAQADSWDAHRTAPWAGWRRLVERLPEATPLDVLDVGCGNGRFGRYLAEQRTVARYVGVDACGPLLECVRRSPPKAARVEPVHGDFLSGDPSAALPEGRFDVVALFGVLHHIPHDDWRRALLSACAARVAPGGWLALAAWRFAELPSLRERALDAPEIRRHTRLDPARLGPADFLMPFGVERSVVRYARAIDEPELVQATADLGLDLVEIYTADGRDGASNRYALLQRPDA